MTTRQENFIDEFILKSGNGAAAARASGYSENGAKVTASKLLSREDVRRSIDDRLDELKSAKVADEKELLEFLTSTMRGELSDDVVIPSGKVIRIQVNSSTRLKACESLCRIFGMFKQREDDSSMTGADLFVSTLERISQNISAAD